jgi:hypothetical protein
MGKLVHVPTTWGNPFPGVLGKQSKKVRLSVSRFHAQLLERVELLAMAGHVHKRDVSHHLHLEEVQGQYPYI